MIMKRLGELLESNGIEYETIHHSADYRARKTASDTHTPAAEFAKTVLVFIDGRAAMAVLPASHTIAIAKLEDSLGAEQVRLAAEWEMSGLCPGAEVGAAPPLGSLFDLPVYVCPVLTRDERITFNAGSHTDAVRIAYTDFERLERPIVVPMSRHEEERAM